MNFHPYISKVAIATAAKVRRICVRKTLIATQLVMLEWFSVQLLVNSEFLKLLLNLSLTHLRAQSACYELKGNLSPVMLNEKFNNSLKISKFTRICMVNNSSMTRGQKLFSHTNPSNFWRLLQSLLLRYTTENLKVVLNFNMLFQLILTKFFKSQLFSFLPKVDHVIN